MKKYSLKKFEEYKKWLIGTYDKNTLKMEDVENCGTHRLMIVDKMNCHIIYYKIENEIVSFHEHYLNKYDLLDLVKFGGFLDE